MPPRGSPMARKMARMYVHDEEVRGDWNASARKAGYTEIPKRSHSTLNRLIAEYGGYVAQTIKTDVVEPIMATNPETDEGWAVLAQQAKPILAGIASGAVVGVKAAQVAALKYIIERGDPKSGDGDNKPAGVLVLPAFGGDRELQVCPRCLKEFRSGLI